MLAIGYLVWLFLNPLLSTYPYASSVAAIQLAMLPMTLLGWLMSSKKNGRANWSITWSALLVFGCALGIWGIIDYTASKSRAHGPLIDANAYAALINLFLIPVVYAFMNGLSSGKTSRFVQLAVIGLLSSAQFASLSRGGLLAFAMVLPAILWLTRGHAEFRWRCASVLGVVLLTYAIVSMGPLAPRDVDQLLFTPIQQLESDNNVRARLLIWKATWDVFRDANQLFGTGLGTFKSYYAAYRNPAETFSSGNLAHNDLLQGLQEGGLIQLSFFLLLVVFAPVWLLFKLIRRDHKTAEHRPDIAVGLAIALIAIFLHSLVNFIQFVAPIALLTGLYLARCWESTATQPERHFRIPIRVTPSFIKTILIVLLAIPIASSLLDGLIFGLFSGNDPIAAHMRPQQRFALINAAIAIRPNNPMPRVAYIEDQIRRANELGFPALLEDAEQQAMALVTLAPALGSGRYFVGKIRAMKGTTEQLLLARADLERAVKLLPAATGVRLELLNVYQRLGQKTEAYQTVKEARKWIPLEHDYASLALFAREAALVAMAEKDEESKEYWSWISTHLQKLGTTG